ncbi:5'/3'-nucleotidase SurE [Blattabacterium cuenoti]|uniref:5'/3'-nucleotidase SurE n=1 Tax=Blattabacterium cuenoti TaxID=1653831 RepID=UPI00163C2B50|nr:5'/3'-nucleotidase SurE [Blattabacterium cuenoti]
MKRRPIILVTNDDGIYAPGIRALVHMMNTLGEVYVIAPNQHKSGISHAITMDTILYCESVKIDNGIQKEWKCSGTPVDCVKIAINNILPKKPDICVSGINHGSNSSINVIYSGTLSAVIEAGIYGIPAIGFSLLDTQWNKDFYYISSLKEEICKIVKKVINYYDSNKIIILNVNIPKLEKKKKIKGIKICKQAKSKWKGFFERRTNPRGKNYYWLSGNFIVDNHQIDNTDDEWALNNGYISIVPIKFDFTDYSLLELLNSWNLIILFIYFIRNF